MAAPQVRHWYDADAPVLTSSLGAINNVLEKVLVDGYNSGGFPALGWTKEYEDAVNHKTAFRNSAANGTGAYLKVQQHHATYTHQQDMTARMFETMSDIDTGVGPFQNEDRVQKVSGSNITTNTIPWVIIGDSIRFHLFVWVYCYNVADLAALRAHASYSKVSHGFFGDMVSLVPTDSFCSAIGLRDIATYNLFFNYQQTLGSAVPSSYFAYYPAFPRKIDGTVIPTSVSTLNMFHWVSGYASFAPYPYLGNLNLTKAYVNVGQHDTGSSSGQSRERRATIPGLRWVFHAEDSFTQLEEITDGTTYLVVILGTAITISGGCLAIMDIGTSWDEE